MSESETPEYVDPVNEAIRLGNEFQAAVNDTLTEQFGGDVTSPGWFEWCAQMDEWNAAVAAESAPTPD